MSKSLCPLIVLFLGSFVSLGEARAQTPASQIQIRAGFAVERVYVPKGQGSWVAMCFDDKGRIYASAERNEGLFRITPPPLDSNGECKVELVSDQWGPCQGMSFINGSLYVVRHGKFPEKSFPPSAILRLKDTDGDDRLDTAETLFAFRDVTDARRGWWEHHVHGIVPGPDGKSLYVIGGDRDELPCEKGRTPNHWNRDSWDFKSIPKPYAGGYVLKTDLDGKNPEWLCMGLRNGYDIAFNRQGDLFTFDSDLEFDVGMPNYRPTAIRQILSGTDSGWAGRGPEMRWSWTPKWEEFQPPVKDIGPGSPTGVCFGYGAKFPAAYQEAFFACDWTFGRIFAVHLTPKGATYQADVELFLSAKGLPITDLAVSPKDGALYFTVGGRGAGSALYRVTYRGKESTAPSSSKAPDPDTAALHKLRRELEAFHGEANPKALAVVWPQLAHEDRAIRGAARAALEWQPVAEWRQRALEEKNPRIALQSMLALARSTDLDKAVQPALLSGLERLDFAKLTADEQCWYLRILTVSASRHGMYSPEVVAKLTKKLQPLLPAADRRVSEELAAMFAAFRSDGVVVPALDLLERSRSQEEQIIYSDALISIAKSESWTPGMRERFFSLIAERAPRWKGGSNVKPKSESVVKAAVAMLSDEQRQKFAERIAAAQKPPAKAPEVKRPFVKEWKLEDLAPVLDAGLKQKRNLENGRSLYSATTCITCHSFQGEGGLAGPDLTNAGGRYTPLDLLDNILNPSKVINEQYGRLVYEMKNGKQIIGRPVEATGDIHVVATNPTNPLVDHVRISRKDVESMTPSRVSSMPDGLLNTLTQDDALDLIAYLVGSGASKEPRIGKLRAGKILFLGNSITLHPPAEGIGWAGNWGMAASAPEKDYVHLVAANIGKAVGIEPKVKVKTIADFERKYESCDLAANLKDELAFKADIVIVAIGENVPSLTDQAKEKYAASFARLLGELKSHGDPALFVRGSFWPDAAKDSVMKKACIDAGGVFVDLGGLGKDASNFARSERKIDHSGVGIHPGDKGMKAIADAIFSAIQKRSAGGVGFE